MEPNNTPPIKRSRGRPRKNTTVEASSSTPGQSRLQDEPPEVAQPEKRKRGRPRKIATVEAHSQTPKSVPKSRHQKDSLELAQNSRRKGLHRDDGEVEEDEEGAGDNEPRYPKRRRISKTQVFIVDDEDGSDAYEDEQREDGSIDDAFASPSHLPPTGSSKRIQKSSGKNKIAKESEPKTNTAATSSGRGRGRPKGSTTKKAQESATDEESDILEVPSLTASDGDEDPDNEAPETTLGPYQRKAQKPIGWRYIHPGRRSKADEKYAPTPLPPAMSKVEVNSLVPDGSYPQMPWIRGHDVWNDTKRKEFQRDNWDGDKKTLWEALLNSNNHIRPLWKAMIHCYGCSPHDLFTYGLMPDPRSRGAITIDGERMKNPYMSQQLAELLKQLIPHPLWEGNISKLRLALQLAVKYSVQDHWVDEILFPVDWRVGTLLGKVTPDMTESTRDKLGTYHYHLCSDWDKNDKNFQDFHRRLKAITEPEKASTLGEKQFFLLKPKHIEAINLALDHVQNETFPAFEPSGAYWNQYISRRSKLHKAVYEPNDLDYLLKLMRRCYLTQLQDVEIRQELITKGLPPWLDIPAGDQYPGYIYTDFAPGFVKMLQLKYDEAEHGQLLPKSPKTRQDSDLDSTPSNSDQEQVEDDDHEAVDNNDNLGQPQPDDDTEEIQEPEEARAISHRIAAQGSVDNVSDSMDDDDIFNPAPLDIDKEKDQESEKVRTKSVDDNGFEPLGDDDDFEAEVDTVVEAAQNPQGEQAKSAHQELVPTPSPTEETAEEPRYVKSRGSKAGPGQKALDHPMPTELPARQRLRSKSTDLTASRRPSFCRVLEWL